MYSDDFPFFVGATLVGAVLLGGALFGSCYTIDQGERGVVLRFGKVTEVAGPGLHFKMPFTDSVREMSVRTSKAKLKLGVYSKDIQAADIELAVNYALDASRVGEIYERAGVDYADRIVIPQLMSKPKDTFGKYNAVVIIQNREKLVSEIQKELEDAFKGTGIIIQSVQLVNIDFSDAYENSVEERMKAEVEVQKVQQNLEREKINADMMRAKAKGEADAQLARAEAKAKSVKLLGEAEAAAIKAKSDAMQANPDYVRMLQAERWDGKLPQTMLPNNAMPIIGASKE